MRALRSAPAEQKVNLQQTSFKGQGRRPVARLLFNALVLASHDRVTLHQEEPYGDILMGRGAAFA